MARVHIESYGCAASSADAEMIAGLLAKGGHDTKADAEESDISVIVTCSVKDATADKMVHRMKSLSAKPLVVAGCLPKAEQDTVERFAPKASMMGPDSIAETLRVVESTLTGNRTISLQETGPSKTDLPRVRLNPMVGIVEIASGCMSECTFCQTKLAKGTLQSYRVGDIVRQIRRDVTDGCKEIWLSSTDNGCYGLDIGSTLPELISAVSAIPGDFAVRVGMMNPMYMPRIQNSLLESFESSKVYKFLHIPVQSGSDQVLADMGRGHTSKTFRDAARRFRRKFNRFTISTDIIVGFPTETDENFEETVQLIQEVQPDIINLSKYSARPGTRASEMKQHDMSEIKRRSRIVYDIARNISLEHNKKWIGWSGPVLFGETTEDGKVRGRNMAYKPIFVKESVDLGSTDMIKITDVTDHSLIGMII